MSSFNLTRVYYKRLMRRMFHIPVFCEICGRDIKQFHVSKGLREKVRIHLAAKKGKEVEFCIECYTNTLEELGFRPWEGLFTSNEERFKYKGTIEKIP